MAMEKINKSNILEKYQYFNKLLPIKSSLYEVLDDKNLLNKTLFLDLRGFEKEEILSLAKTKDFPKIFKKVKERYNNIKTQINNFTKEIESNYSHFTKLSKRVSKILNILKTFVKSWDHNILLENKKDIMFLLKENERKLFEQWKFDEIYTILKEKFDDISNRLKKIDNVINLKFFLLKIIQRYMRYKLSYLDLLYYGTESELKKLTDDFKNYLFKNDEELIKKLDEINTVLFGKKTIDNPVLIKRVYTKINNLKNTKNFEQLNEKEKASIEEFLSDISKYAKDIQDSKLTNTEINVIDNEKSTEYLKDFYLSAQDTKKVFELIFKFYKNILGKSYDYSVEVKDTNAVFIWDWKLILKNENYNLERVMRLITHEVEKHSLQQFNVKRNFNWVQDANYLEMEESMAVTFEEFMISWKLPLVSKHIPLLTASEIYKQDKLKDFIKAYLKLIKAGENPERRYQRLKWFYPFDKEWAYRLFILYTSGLDKVLEFIKNKETEKLFYGAFSYETLKNKKLTDYLEKLPSAYPVFVGEVIKYIVVNNLIDDVIKNKKIPTDKLIPHIKNKYENFWIKLTDEKINNLKQIYSKPENVNLIIEVLKIMKRNLN